MEKFRGIVAHGGEVLAIFISSAMSGTYATALQARDKILQEYPKARI